MKFGDYLRQCREEKGWTQPEAAARADIEQSYLSKLETGRSYPSEEVYNRLIEAYGIDTADLAAKVSAAEIENLREVKQVRGAVIAREKRTLSIARGWMLAGLAFLMMGGASLGLAVTAEDQEYVVYHYRSDGVLRMDESLDSFDIVRDRFALDQTEQRDVQSAMVARLDEVRLPRREFMGRSYVTEEEGGRRYFQLVEDEAVSIRSPLRWFLVPALAFLVGSFGAFFISFRWKP